jgi:hypothetical protein
MVGQLEGSDGVRKTSHDHVLVRSGMSQGLKRMALTEALTNVPQPMFVERKVHHSALFTYLVGWHAGAVSLPPGDITLTQLACPLSDVMFCLHSGILNLSPNRH